MVESESDACLNCDVNGGGIDDELTFSPSASDTGGDDLKESEAYIHTPDNMDGSTRLEESQEVRVAV